ncbi:AAA family ATPase, partial [Candidatus Pelagibacter ubique]|nr:AAA family ATPase [Candidatus Pelagibacter ubique]
SGDDERRRNVDILSGYQEKFSGSGGNSSMAGITKTMDKFLIAPGLRQIPKRYFVKGLQTDYVGPSAENLGELLANPEINRETNKWFQRLEIPYKVDIQKSGNYYEIIFAPKNSKIKISSMHVGLGYPLILPFIVQCIIAKNKIILIEEPEVHLHPKIEADLADLIVESSLLRNNQFIIETHSEDFLLRILKSIRQEKIKPEHVSVNYITPNDKTGSKINKITINKYGQYTTPWKDDLFADRIKELR